MPRANVKQQAHALIDQLPDDAPDDAPVDDTMRELCEHRAIARGR
jgi:hypothetical protein